MNVYIGGAKDYSAMRGPCPEGFHIPMKDEWVGVNGIMATLGNTTVNSYISILHLHLGRFIERQGTKYPDEPQIGYWSCTKYANNNYAYALFLYSYNGAEIVNPNQQFQKNRGFPIRPFKDTFVTPTASWTVIQGALGSAGIFWNTTDGIISITGDGITGYTIADKDLGATTVYNNGNTKTDANCGKCYQWGNNYGFVFSSGLTTSSTQVNASNYGPGNYYSSSTFVTTDPRDSSNNANLWGGETGIVSIAELKQAYIGEEAKPTKLEYIYNFDDGTWTNALLDSEGWVNGGYGLNASSSGLVFADTSTDRGGNRRKDLKVPTGWKRVTLYFKGVKSDSWGGVTGSLGTVWGDSTTHDFLAIKSNYYNPQYNGLMINGSWMQQLTYKSSVEGTATLDVENWTYTSTIDGSTKTGAVTQFNITEDVYFWVSLSKGYYATPSAIYKYHVTFEY